MESQAYPAQFAPFEPLSRPQQRALVNRYRVLALLLLSAVTLFHLWYVASGIVELAPDEAHYWEWSRRLDWSYYSKGPMVAYLIAASTRLGGHAELFVRLPAVLLALGTGVLAYLLARRLFNSERAGLLVLLIICASPLYAAGSILMTTDAPFVFFWALAVLSFRSAVTSSRSGVWWYVLALALGLGFLSKYTMIIFVPCLLGYLCASPAARRYFLRPEPYGAALLGGLCAIPVFVWNRQHGWVSAQHVMGQAGLAHEAIQVSAKTFFEFLGSQIGVVSPLLFVALAAAMVRCARLGIRQRRDRQRREEHLLLFVFSVPVLLAFLLWSFVDKVQANWAAPAYLTGMVALAGWWDEELQNTRGGEGRRRLLGRIAVVLCTGFLVVAVEHFPAILPTMGIRLPSTMDPTARLHGWKQLGEAVEKHVTNNARFIMSDQYQIASELAFYVAGQPRTYNINLGRRMNQYDVWGGLDGLRDRDGLVITYGDVDAPQSLREACASTHKIDLIQALYLGQVAQTFSIFECRRYHGLLPPPAITY